MNIRLVAGTIVTILFLSLNGCSRPSARIAQLTPVAAKGTAVVSKQLHKIGLPSHYQQKRLTVLMPAASFFKNKTMQLRSNNRPAIDKMSRLIQAYSKKNQMSHIRVIGYPDHGSQSGLAISHQYAVIVAGYMWNKGVPVRIATNLKNSPAQPWIKQRLNKNHDGVIIEVF